MEPDLPVVLDDTQTPWYRHRWVKWASIAGAVTTVIVVAVATFLFVAWNASSEKALLDAADYALKNPGTYHVQTGGVADLTVQTDGQKYALDGTLDTVPVSAVISGNMLYAKSSDPQLFYDTFLKPSSESKAAAALMKGILPNLKNRWISINLDSTSVSSTFFDTLRCLLNARIALTSNTSGRQQLVEAYGAHPFLSVVRSGASSYRLLVNGIKLSAFQKTLSTTDTPESLANCSQTLRLLKGGTFIGAAMTVTLSPTKHTLDSLVLGGKASGETKITTDYSKVSKITVPAGSIDISQILGSLIQTLFGASLSK